MIKEICLKFIVLDVEMVLIYIFLIRFFILGFMELGYCIRWYDRKSFKRDIILFLGLLFIFGCSMVSLFNFFYFCSYGNGMYFIYFIFSYNRMKYYFFKCFLKIRKIIIFRILELVKSYRF